MFDILFKVLYVNSLSIILLLYSSSIIMPLICAPLGIFINSF